MARARGWGSPHTDIDPTKTKGRRTRAKTRPETKRRRTIAVSDHFAQGRRQRRRPTGSRPRTMLGALLQAIISLLGLFAALFPIPLQLLDAAFAAPAAAPAVAHILAPPPLVVPREAYASVVQAILAPLAPLSTFVAPIFWSLVAPLLPILQFLPGDAVTLLLGPPSVPGACFSPLRLAFSRSGHGMPGLAACLDTFTVPHAWYTADSYDAAQPSIEERAAWIKAVQRMLDVSDGLDAGAEPNARLGPCNAIHIPSALSSTYAVGTAHGHCVLYEIQAPCGVYARGWGWMAVPALAGESEKWWTTNTNSKLLQSKTSQRRKKLHISAPHPGYDLGTPEQAAGVYAASGARSLLVAGRKRTSYLTESTCVRAPAMSTSDEESSKTPDWGRGKEAYWMTDPAHNDEEPFVDASITIFDWQRDPAHGGCVPGTCALLQLHGKGATTCAKDEVFVSGGLANATAPPAFYTSPHPAARLACALRDVFPPSPSSPMSGPPSGSDSHTLSKEQLCTLHSNKAQPQGKHGLVRMPQFRHTQRRGAISLPTTSTCALTASRNVVGRYVNGVPRGEVCWRGAVRERRGCGVPKADGLSAKGGGEERETRGEWGGRDQDITAEDDKPECRGVWVHAEQSRAARGEAAYKGWARAVQYMVEWEGEEGE